MSPSEVTSRDPLRPKTLEEFRGQPDLTKQLRTILMSASKRGAMPDHMLFNGPPGLGKTTLANIVASTLGHQFKMTVGPSLEKPADVISLLNTARVDPVVIFIDEIHRMAPPAEEALYSALEDNVISITLGEGRTAEHVNIPLKPFVLIGATTNKGIMSAPLRDRFGFHGTLQPYSQDDLAEIITRNAAKLGLNALPGAAAAVASRSRGTPRLANNLLSRVQDSAVVEDVTDLDGEFAARVLADFGYDDLGLDPSSRAILEVLASHFKGGPAGLGSIASAVQETPNAIETMYEPHFLREGLIVRTPAGRVLTTKGFRHIGKTPPYDWEY